MSDPRYVLGVGGFIHDYNCVLVDVRSGRVAMREAERYSRRKHHVPGVYEDLLALPLRCCADLDCRPSDIDTVVLGHKDEFAAKQRLRGVLDDVAGGPRFIEVDHHLCHAAAAYYGSGWPAAAILSLDGYGDGSSGLLAVGTGGRIEELQRLSEADSIGLEYLRATMHLGLGGIGAEGKTQGLAAYGEPVLWQAYMNEIDIRSDGKLTLSRRLRGQGSRLAREGGYLLCIGNLLGERRR